MLSFFCRSSWLVCSRAPSLPLFSLALCGRPSLTLLQGANHHTHHTCISVLSHRLVSHPRVSCRVFCSAPVAFETASPSSPVTALPCPALPQISKFIHSFIHPNPQLKQQRVCACVGHNTHASPVATHLPSPSLFTPRARRPRFSGCRRRCTPTRFPAS